MTEASQQALIGMRDWTTLQWYVIPLMAIVFYIYTKEMHKARETGNWDAVFAGLTLFGMDFVNETINGLIFHFTQRSALWTAPGPTAFRTMMGWNIEIMFMFAISGIIYYYTINPDYRVRILGIPNWWFWGITYAAFCVLVEWFLNKGGHLVWEYEFWNRSFKGVWLIFLFGYFHFYVAMIFVLSRKTMKAKIATNVFLYSLAIGLNVVCMGVLGWLY
ncbi:MAG: hypothetical protein K1Y02_10940 [Candidatus Hydrogenedentes bacterium]|nr:hypothetical protein [Candidatus Hydrogenedentota bacterium]